MLGYAKSTGACFDVSGHRVRRGERAQVVSHPTAAQDVGPSVGA